MTESLKELGASPEKVLDLIPEGVSLDALRDRGFVPISFGGGVMTFAASDYSCAVAAQLLAASAGASA